ncbi:tetratricopeptide repeat protein [Comamonas sp. GB3 AK4-5]|uniref:tetratricopeptide repeat protein n=1 Tax=Comamonas sp. GB3 AK4-5 TaxID=3231487 RepID=UPI00351F2612
MSLRPALFCTLRALTVAALLAAGGAAHADDYSDVAKLVREGKTAQAITQADKYLSANQRDPQMRFLKGTAQAAAGQNDEAITTFTQLTEEYPELPEPYNNLAVIYASQDRLDQARSALETAVRNNPGYAVAHENLGDIYARLAFQSYSRSQQLRGPNKALKLKLSTLRSLLQAPAPH